MVHATTLLAFVALAASSALAAPQNARRFLEYSVHEERDILPTHWARSELSPLNKRGADKENFILPVRINLAQNNVDKAHDILMDISDPASPRYSDHLSPHDVAKLVRIILRLFCM
jgi:tripeptidyl-peptidase-1